MLARIERQIAENDLFHVIIRGDVKHVYKALRMQRNVDHSGNGCQVQKQNGRFPEAAFSFLQHDGNGHYDHKDVPEKTVYCKDGQSVEHAAGIQKYSRT